MKKALARIGFIAVSIALAACSRGGSQSSASPGASGAPSGQKTIGVSIQNREAQFYQDMESGMRRGGKIRLQRHRRRRQPRQRQAAEPSRRFHLQNVDAIVLTPYDSQAIGSAIVEANKARIPVFTADIASTATKARSSPTSPATTFRAALQAGKLMCAAVPTSGSGRDHRRAGSDERARPRQRFQSSASLQICPAVTIVADIDGRRRATRRSSDTGDILQAHKDLKGVFGINDDSALGALAAVEGGRHDRQGAIVGYDATPEARTAIAAGEMYGDAIQHPDQDRREDDRRDRTTISPAKRRRAI